MCSRLLGDLWFYTLFLVNAIVKLVSVNHINMVFAIFVKVFVRVVLNYLNMVAKNKYGPPQNQKHKYF